MPRVNRVLVRDKLDRGRRAGDKAESISRHEWGNIVRVRLLGPVDVTIEGTPRAVSGLRRKAVLAVLGLYPGEAVSTDRLIDAVWGEKPPATAANTLQSHVSYLRGLLGARKAILARPPGYVLDVPPEATDVAVAEQLIRQGEQAVDPAEGAAALRTALALWRGRSLADVAEVDWLHEQAQRLDNIRLDAVVALVEARLALGEHTQLLPELQHLAERHRFREHIHRQLMLALYRTGRQADALNTYQRLRRRLDDELGIDPSPALRELESAILRQDNVLDQPRPAITLNQATAIRLVPAQLPLAVPAFTGRKNEIALLDAVLATHDSSHTPSSVVPIVAVSGSAGVGKSALAVHWAHQVAALFPDGQLYVNLRGFDPGGSVMDPAEAIRGFLDAFGVPADRIPTCLDAQASLYRSVLAGKQVLVVVDNARDDEHVRPLLPGWPGCLVVVTSRNALTGLVAIDGAHPLILKLPSAAEAREMLTRRLGTQRVAAEPEAVDGIVASCARLPLALAVAAARASADAALSLAALAAQLHDTAAALDPFHGGDPASDVRAVFSWSYQILSPEAAQLFRWLGLCQGPDIALAAAASLTGLPLRQVRPQLAELTRVHLLSERTPGRYCFHDLLRAYAMEQAHLHDSDDQRSAALHRLLDHYLHTAHTAAMLLNPLRDPIIITPAQPGVRAEGLSSRDQAMAWFAVEYPVLLAVIGHPPLGFDGHVWKLAWTLNTFLDRQGCPEDNAAVQQAGLTAAQRLGERHAQAYAHRDLGYAQITVGRLADAQDHNCQALRLFDEIGDHVAGAQAHLNLAWTSERRGDFVGALSHSQLALRRYQAVGLPGQANALNTLGWCHAHIGDHVQALTYCQQALALFSEFGDRHGEAATWDSLGYLSFQLGDRAQAIEYYQRAIDIYREVGDRYKQADTLANLGDGHDQVGDRDAAHQAWRQALTLLDQLDHPAAAKVRIKLYNTPRPPASRRGRVRRQPTTPAGRPRPGVSGGRSATLASPGS